MFRYTVSFLQVWQPVWWVRDKGMDWEDHGSRYYRQPKFSSPRMWWVSGIMVYTCWGEKLMEYQDSRILTVKRTHGWLYRVGDWYGKSAWWWRPLPVFWSVSVKVVKIESFLIWRCCADQAYNIIAVTDFFVCYADGEKRNLDISFDDVHKNHVLTIRKPGINISKDFSIALS